jgi:hypothetical protein
VEVDAAIDGIQRDLEPVRTDLLAGGVFAEEALGHWIRTAREEAAAARPRPHGFTTHYDL